MKEIFKIYPLFSHNEKLEKQLEDKFGLAKVQDFIDNNCKDLILKFRTIIKS